MLANTTQKKTNHRILLIDDDPIGMTLLKEIANRFGYTYDTASDGKQALEIITSKPANFYSVVVSDLMMPVMGGLELIRAVKALPAYVHLPFILQTARNDEASQMEGIQAGAFYYLLKPLNFDVVGKVIESAIRDLHNYNHLQDQLSSVRTAFSLVENACFKFKTIAEAQKLAAALSFFATQPNKASLGLFELLENAVEHGNLGITYDDKSLLIDNQTLLQEIDRRLQLDENRNKFVTIDFRTEEYEKVIEITDMGNGFDFEQYLQFCPERLTDSHGRGIMIANSSCFKFMRYSNKGRTVTCVLN